MVVTEEAYKQAMAVPCADQTVTKRFGGELEKARKARLDAGSCACVVSVYAGLCWFCAKTG